MSVIDQPRVELPEPRARALPLPILARLDRWLGLLMFVLALVFLTLSAGIIHRIGQGHTTLFEAEVILWGLLALWPIFVLEALLHLVVCRRDSVPLWRRGLAFVLICAAPPFRLGGRAYAEPNKIWLPWIGWSEVDRHLRRRLERFFSVPMIGIALFVLPLLAMEFFWLEEVRASFALSLALDIGTSVIWMAFALELILMVSVSQDKVWYLLKNWLDVAVVALPLVDFLPILRLLRLTRLVELQQVSRLGRLYRLRGLLLKMWRAVLLLEMLQRLLGNYKGSRLKSLKKLLSAREEEMADLRRQITELEAQVDLEKRQLSPAPRPSEPTESAPATAAGP